MIVKNIQMNRKKLRGAIAVEMAILMIPLIIMAFGVVEFGRGLYEYNTLAKSVRDGVRHISQSVETAELDAEGIKLTVYGSIVAATPVPLLPNLSESNVSIDRELDASSGLNFVTVTITGYRFDFIINPLGFFDPGNTETGITFDTIHATMRQL